MSAPVTVTSSARLGIAAKSITRGRSPAVPVAVRFMPTSDRHPAHGRKAIAYATDGRILAIDMDATIDANTAAVAPAEAFVKPGTKGTPVAGHRHATLNGVCTGADGKLHPIPENASAMTGYPVSEIVGASNDPCARSVRVTLNPALLAALAKSLSSGNETTVTLRIPIADDDTCNRAIQVIPTCDAKDVQRIGLLMPVGGKGTPDAETFRDAFARAARTLLNA